MNKVSIQIVNPPSPDGEIYIRDICRWGRKSREGMIWPQTSLAYLAAMVPEDMTVEIVDAIAEKMKWPAFKEMIGRKSPSVYVSYITGTTFDIDARGIALAKEKGAVTIAIGTHPSAVPEDTLNKIPELDIVIRHEPEMTFKAVLAKLKNRESLADCLGIAFRDEDGQVVINQDRPLLEKLDELPMPIHSMLPLDKYWMPFLGKRYTWVLTNRGCPYQCSFCFEGILWGKKVRHRSPQSILEELVYLDKIGVRNILFLADLFTCSKKFVLDLCNLIIEKNLKLRWVCNSRVDTVDEEMITEMKKAGCWLIAFGIESGSQKVLDACRKDVAVEKASKAIEMVHKRGIRTWGYFMMGLPEETKDTIDETIRLAKALPLDLALFHVAVPYPGTDYYEQAREEGWLVTQDWSFFDMNDTAVIAYPGLNAEEILRETKRAYRKFYLRLRQIFRMLNLFTSSKDFFLLWKIARGFINWTFSRKVTIRD
jgi:radical SAM superfamily enzyme YgiQ (UPF0313 family)